MTIIEDTATTAPKKKRQRAPMKLTARELPGADVLLRDGAPVEIELAVQGSFRGHAAGPFKLDHQVFSEIVANWERDGRRPIAIDYEHQSEREAIGPTPACGWITALRIAGASLMATVEWLPEARDLIRSGAYRWISPAVRFNSKDRVTGQPIGARLTSAGVTNQPFLKMERLTAKDTAPTPETAPAPTTLAADMTDAVLASDTPNSDADAIALFGRVGESGAPMWLTKLRALEADRTALMSEVERLTEENEKGRKARKKLKRLKSELAESRVAVTVDRAIFAHRLTPDSRPALLALCAAKPDAFAALYPGAMVDGDQMHLLADLTTRRQSEEEATTTAKPVKKMRDVGEEIKRIQAKQPKLGWDEVCQLAHSRVVEATRRMRDAE